jgi:hypothetical protein
MTVLTNPVLVLNKSWSPIKIVTLQRAITLLFPTYVDGEPKATIIDPSSYALYTWNDWSQMRPAEGEDKIQAGNVCFKVPTVIKLTRYNKIPIIKANCNRRNLFKRDQMTCQYCGCKPGSEELTIDHIVPRSQGGETSWLNTALCCMKCNLKKGNRTPAQAGMKLLNKPFQPKTEMLKFHASKPIKDWEGFLGEMYWEVPLRP